MVPAVSVCLFVLAQSVCLGARVSQTVSKLHQVFGSCYPWPWLNAAVVALRYVVYTSGLVDDVTFACNRPDKGDASRAPTRQRAARI